MGAFRSLLIGFGELVDLAPTEADVKWDENERVCSYMDYSMYFPLVDWRHFVSRSDLMTARLEFAPGSNVVHSAEVQDKQRAFIAKLDDTVTEAFQAACKRKDVANLEGLAGFLPGLLAIVDDDYEGRTENYACIMFLVRNMKCYSLIANNRNAFEKVIPVFYRDAFYRGL